MVDIINTLFFKCPLKIFLAINEKNYFPSEIAKKVDTTYAHVVGILNDFEKEGLIEFQKEGRVKIISLTKKGEKVRELLNQLKNLLKGGERVE